MSKLVLMRHGQSVWNEANLFTGWVDVPLTSKGIDEALKAGEKIKDIPVDLIFTTFLIRASMTAMLAMSRHSPGKYPVMVHSDGKMKEWGKIHSGETEGKCIPVIQCWELNERMYGDLQGFNKAQMAEKYGADQIKQWRRSFDAPPPNGESLAMTGARSIPYFEENVVPHLEQGRNVLISAHGNSLRSIIMHLDGLSKEEVLTLEIPTGEPLVYEFDKGAFTRFRSY